MKAPERFRIMITGTRAYFIARDNVDNGRAFKHLFPQLLAGVEIPEGTFRPWGLEVEVEEDMDQGDA
jgi:hypothetical protein